MNTTTLAMPPVGQRVRVTDGIGLPNGWENTPATVVGEYAPSQPYVIFDGDISRYGGPRPHGCEGSWVITGWDVIAPNIGDKVIPLNPGDVAIPAEYHGKVGTVTSSVTNNRGSVSGLTIAAEFQSHQKPDDTTLWSFNWWKPADGHTLTVSQYRPEVGDKVTITGYLSSEGIIDTVAHDGYIRAVDGDIWTIDSPLYGRQVSGPGYITLVLAASEAEPVRPSEEPRIITELRDEAATLKRELDRANERVEQYGSRAGKWERDFLKYATRIMQEAIDRDWCSEYERIMDEIEGELEIAEIPKRRNRRRTTVRIRAEVYVDREVFIDEDDDGDDPDNWYEDNESDDALGSEWADEQVVNEYDNSGFDSVEYETR